MPETVEEFINELRADRVSMGMGSRVASNTSSVAENPPNELTCWHQQCVLAGAHKKSPRALPGAFAHTKGFSLPADLDAGSSGARAANTGTFTVGDNFDPERVLALVVRGGAGLAQRI